MNVLLDTVFPRTLDRIVAEYSGFSKTHPGTRLEFWTFDNGADRREAERKLLATGVEARIYSAYKPLLCCFLEDVAHEGLARVEVIYPKHPGCAPDRFLLEAYPLSAFFPDAEVSFAAAEVAAEIAGEADGNSARAIGEAGDSEAGDSARNNPAGSFTYLVRLVYADGRAESRRVFAPNRVYEDHTGETVVTSAGWMRLRAPDGSETEGTLQTEYEAIYSDALKAVSDHEWGKTEPFFEVLSMRVTLPACDIPLPLGEEVLSLKEALHEELYFSLLELFQKKTGRPVSDRTIRPGQAVPEISGGEVPSLKIELKPLSAEDKVTDMEAGTGTEDLAFARHPIAAARVSAELEMIAGLIECRPFQTKSYSGRTISGIYRPGSEAAVMISGGQHANETTGIVGALRAARELARRPASHFAVSPLENPDGYALHRMLCVENPKHMHHAARYTALGNDLEYQVDGRLYEKAIRVEAERLTGAKLHINLHGYASHEWTRPLSGYIPRGFPTWMLPHGFFLVLRHHAAWADRAREFLELLTLRLAAVPELLAFTRDQLKLYSCYVKTPPFQVINGFPCELSINETSTIPLRLITEYPDETIHGDAFIAGHTAQKETVLAAYEVFQSLQAKTKAKDQAPADENFPDRDSRG
ncbi:MAG: hypothetical protein Q8O15_10235 [Rectinemataceae bacterium]|nr:hypothetical protein [Rectinemataceae bacterium]